MMRTTLLPPHHVLIRLHCRRMSVTGLPDLPIGGGARSGDDSRAPPSSLPVPRVLPSPLSGRMPPMEPREAGIDSEGDENRRSGSAGPGSSPGATTTTPLPRRTDGGIEHGVGPAMPKPRLDPAPHRRGPGRTSDTPPVPTPPTAPPESETASDDPPPDPRGRVSEELSRSGRQPPPSSAREAALPPPPGMGLGRRGQRGNIIPPQATPPQTPINRLWRKIREWLS